jgi:hypothetical protein
VASSRRALGRPPAGTSARKPGTDALTCAQVVRKRAGVRFLPAPPRSQTGPAGHAVAAGSGEQRFGLRPCPTSQGLGQGMNIKWHVVVKSFHLVNAVSHESVPRRNRSLVAAGAKEASIVARDSSARTASRIPRARERRSMTGRPPAGWPDPGPRRRDRVVQHPDPVPQPLRAAGGSPGIRCRTRPAPRPGPAVGPPVASPAGPVPHGREHRHQYARGLPRQPARGRHGALFRL